MVSTSRLALLLMAAAFFCTAPLTTAQARVLDAVAIMHQPASNNICALTFDDGPTAFTSQLLDSLREEGVHATFFLLGQQIVRRPDVVRRMAEEGHEVASHGYSHPNMRKLGTNARYYELHQTNMLLAELGVAPQYFRPPYGKFDPALASMAQDMGMATVMWTTDSRDWKRRPDYRNMPTATGKRLQPEEMRGVFLFHDTKQTTVQDVKQILTELREGGCQRFVTVSEYFQVVDSTEPLMTARPEIPERELRQQTLLPAAGPAVVAAESPAPAQDATPAPTTAAVDEVKPAEAAVVPLARSSSPWFFPALFRSGG